MVSTKFGVTKRWYKQFSCRLLKQYASWWGEAEVHTARSGNTPLMSSGRLKTLITKAWLQLRLLEREWQRGVQKVSLDLRSPMEETLGGKFSVYYAQMRQRRKAQTEAWGIPTDVLVHDGHQKDIRRVCCMQRVTSLPCKELGGICVVNCPGTPANGQVICPKHVNDPVPDAAAKTVRSLHWRAQIGKTWDDLLSLKVMHDGRVQSKKPSEVPDAQIISHIRDVSLEKHASRLSRHQTEPGITLEDIADDMTLQYVKDLKCQTHKQVAKGGHGSMRKQRATARSGGFLVACTPNGFAVDAFEFMGAESCAQRYLFIARVKHLYPNFKICVGDDNCHLRRFAEKMPVPGSLATELAYPNMIYILDRFHARGHVDPWCLANVHPDVEENAKHIEGKNTSACEIFFSWLARYKHSFRKMGRWTGNFYIQELIDLHNVDKFYQCEIPPSAPTVQCGASAAAHTATESSDSAATQTSGSSGDSSSDSESGGARSSAS